jgi:hypothetical protein
MSSTAKSISWDSPFKFNFDSTCLDAVEQLFVEAEIQPSSRIIVQLLAGTTLGQAPATRRDIEGGTRQKSAECAHHSLIKKN